MCLFNKNNQKPRLIMIDLPVISLSMIILWLLILLKEMLKLLSMAPRELGFNRKLMIMFMGTLIFLIMTKLIKDFH